MKIDYYTDALLAIADSGVDSVSARMCCRSASLELSRLSASEAALLAALESLMCWDNLKPEFDDARDLIACTKEARNA